MERLTMRKIRKVLELHSKGLSNRDIALSRGIGRTTVARYLELAQLNGLSWPLPEGMTDAELGALLFPGSEDFNPSRRIEPDWPEISRALKGKSVTLETVWSEYHDRHEGVNCYSYSRFCHLYRKWNRKSKATMLQHHAPGEKMFVDYAGQIIPIHCPRTGKAGKGQVFVATLGASNYIFVEVTESQRVRDWVGSHARAFAYFGGVTEYVVPDNLKSGVIRASLYEPVHNETYEDMCDHFGTTIFPTRPNRPKDKAKVEKSVQLVSQQITARLRNHKFFSVAEANEAIAPLLADLNNRHSDYLGGSRRELFLKLDKPALSPLPLHPYEFGWWCKCVVGVDYHVLIDGVRYSVPCGLIGEKVEVRCTDSRVEVFHNRVPVSEHDRKHEGRGNVTVRDHMPENHKHMLDSTVEGLTRRAAFIGRWTGEFVKALIEGARRPELGRRASRGVLQLAESYGEDRTEAACRHAIEKQSISYNSLKSILTNGIDLNPSEPILETQPIAHSNIRGPQYYT